MFKKPYMNIGITILVIGILVMAGKMFVLNTKTSKELEINGELPQIALGYCGHSLVIKSDNTLWTWGDNSVGQLGNNITEFIPNTVVPFPTKIMDDVIAAYANMDSSLALKSDFSLWSWGDNDCGQLGNGTKKTSATPSKIMDNVKIVAAGSLHNLAIKKDGSLWAWGCNDQGQLGNGNTNDSKIPVKIMDSVCKAYCGGSSSYAIKTDGSLWAWGKNIHGELGTGTAKNSSVPIKILDNAETMYAGDYTMLILKKDKSLWGWGRNWFGELGIGNIDEQHTPIHIMDNVVSVCMGSLDNYSAALKDDGTLWACGYYWDGIIGDPEGEPTMESLVRRKFEKIMDDAVYVKAGNGTPLAIKKDGTLWKWKNNLSTRSKYNTPMTKKVLDNVAFTVSIDEKDYAVKKDGSLWAWGLIEWKESGRIDDESPIKIFDEGSINTNYE